MADLNARIKPKKSSTASEVPQAADLEVAELAVNTADGKLFTKHTDGSIVEISGGGGGGGAVDSVNGNTGVVVVDLDSATTQGATTNNDISVGDLLTVQGDGAAQDGRLKLNCSANTHGVTIQSPPHSDAATYTLTLPSSAGTAGQVLTSQGGSQLTWEDAAAGAVASVNGQTGAVALDVGDLGDVSLTGTEYITTGKYTSTGSYPGGGQYRIWVGTDPDILQIRNTDNLGTNHSAALGQISTGDTFEASADGATGWITVTALSDATLDTNVYDINISDADTAAIGGLGSSLYFRFKVPAAKADGDYLVWNNGDATWEPGKAVVTVNGQSGAAVLDVNDLNNFSGWLKYTVDDSGTSNPAAGTLSINFAGWDIFFSTSDAEGGGYYTEYGTLVATDTMEIIFADQSSTTATVSQTANYTAANISVNFADNNFLASLSNGDTVYLRFPGRFGGTSASDDQVLTWDEASGQWESRSLGIQDLNDYGPSVSIGTIRSYNYQSSGFIPSSGNYTQGNSQLWTRFNNTDANGDPVFTVPYDVPGSIWYSSDSGATWNEITYAFAQDETVNSSLYLHSPGTTFTDGTVLITDSYSLASSPTDGQVLTWVDANNQWESKSLAVNDISDISTEVSAAFERGFEPGEDYVDGVFETSTFRSGTQCGRVMIGSEGFRGAYPNAYPDQTKRYDITRIYVDLNGASLSPTNALILAGSRFAGLGVNANGAGSGYYIYCTNEFRFYANNALENMGGSVSGAFTITAGFWNEVVIVVDWGSDRTANPKVSLWVNGAIAVTNYQTTASYTPYGTDDDKRWASAYVSGPTVNRYMDDLLTFQQDTLSWGMTDATIGDISQYAPTASATNGQVLVYNSGSSLWQPGDVINKATLQAEVAAATDFADFQSRIAAL